ncbi:MAG: hypothetical protein EXS32_08295 [Opitutus sp.]|nr:hypothetical protein [Opitutus sp.]
MARISGDHRNGAAQATYSVIDIGVLGTGTLSQAVAINNAGQVVGVSYTNGTNTAHAILYSNGSLTDLGLFANGGTRSYAAAINDSGVIVGVADTLPTFGGATVAHGFRTTTAGGAFTDLGTVGAGVQSDARGIANNGVIVGQATLNGVGDGGAFYHSGGTMTIFGGVTTNANGVNVVGGVTTIVGYTDRIVGSGESAYTVIEAFTYTVGGGMINIGSLGNGVVATISKANAISSTGLVVDESSLDSLNYIQHAFRYTVGGGMTDLGTLGGESSHALAVNSAGLIVGDADLFDSTHHAFSFTTGGTMTDLNTLIPGNSGWTLIGATGVNDLGQIVGYGAIGDEIHGYVLTAIPEPATSVRHGDSRVSPTGTLALSRRRVNRRERGGEIARERKGLLSDEYSLVRVLIGTLSDSRWPCRRPCSNMFGGGAAVGRKGSARVKPARLRAPPAAACSHHRHARRRIIRQTLRATRRPRAGQHGVCARRAG